MSVSFTTAHEAYLDNADYDVEASISKARLFVTACRRLIAFTVTGSSSGGGSLEDEPRKYADALRAAKAFIAAHADSAPIRHPDFANFRA